MIDGFSSIIDYVTFMLQIPLYVTLTRELINSESARLICDYLLVVLVVPVVCKLACLNKTSPNALGSCDTYPNYIGRTEGSKIMQGLPSKYVV